jgi:hypothetical protein
VVDLARLGGAAGGLVVIDELDHDLAIADGRAQALLRELIQVTSERRMVVVLLAKDDSDAELDGALELAIDELGDEDLDTLVDRTCSAFTAAYPINGLSTGRSELAKALKKRFHKEYDPRGWGPRYFVRVSIEACEVVRARGLPSLAEVEV